METTNPYDPSEDSVAQRTPSRRHRRLQVLRAAAGQPQLPQQARAPEDPRVQLRRLPAQRRRRHRRRGGRAGREGPGAGRAVLRQQARVRPGHLARGRQVGRPRDAARRLGRRRHRARVRRLGHRRLDGCGRRPRTATSSRRPTGPTGCRRIWDPAKHGGQVPRLEVRAAIDEIFGRFKVVRMYADPPDWKTEIDDWAARVRREGRHALGDVPADADARRLHCGCTPTSSRWTRSSPTTATRRCDAREATRASWPGPASGTCSASRARHRRSTAP
jgi:hypothetical protein